MPPAARSTAMHDSFTRAGRADPVVQHPAWRSRRRRGRRGGVWLPAVRDPGGVRRRPDGRAHARICRQEDRIARGQAGGPGDRGVAADDPGLHRAQLGDHPRAGRAAGNKGPHGFSPRSSTPSPARSGTTARPSPGSPPTRPYYDTTAGHRHVGRAVLRDRADARHRRQSLAAKKHTPESAGSFPTTGRPLGRPARSGSC